ncbi:LCP family protein [Thermopolyspora sp. NPDC052614]|uniref:LCP family protein n=1 Tax=Thermopolyspora sp. NPDC052614 TaxID=3155682 RepID=UPI0034285E99
MPSRHSRAAGTQTLDPYREGPLGEPDGGDEPPRGRRRSQARGGGGKRMRVLAYISVVLTAVMVMVTLAAYKVYRDALGGINRRDIATALGKNRPANTTGALNVLLVGSDTRAGKENHKYGQKTVGERTDTIILMHISPNRDKALLVSLPRDSMVQHPECVNPTTKARIAPRLEMINAAFNDGGIVCTIKTIEANTKIRIDHYIKVDFAGFKNIVNALGGIEICLPHAVDDKKAKLKLPAGKQIVMGEEALGYVRLRSGIGDGSDISRIKRQQVFLNQVVKKATSSDLLTNFGKLNAFVTAAAHSVEMDSDLNTEVLIEIAQSGRKLVSGGIKFITIPWEPWPANKDRVQWKQPDADNLFNAIRSDVDLPTATPKASSSASKAPTKVAIKPGQVRIQVLNGTSVPGKAKEAAEALAAQGFKVVEVGNALQADGTEYLKTKVLYPERAANGADYATPVIGKLLTKGVTAEAGRVRPNGAVTPFTPSTSTTTAATGAATGTGATDKGPLIQLIIGKDWDGVKIPVKIPDSARVVDSKTNVCSA